MPKNIGYIPFQGGYDSKTPVLQVKPGRLRDIKNWYQDVQGGYISFSGYERYSGQVSPSSAMYAVLDVSLSGSVSAGDTITYSGGNVVDDDDVVVIDGTGVVFDSIPTSITAIVIAVASTYLVLAKWTGTFGVGTISVGGITVGSCDGPQVLNYVFSNLLAAQYKNLAADQYRADITTVGGANCSGGILGITSLNGIDYVFRNNAAGSAAVMYKSSVSGWTACDLGSVLDFDAGSAVFAIDETLTGTDSGHTATVKKVVLISGSWENDNLTTNGTFASDVSWTKGTGWTIAGGKATHAAGSTADLEQALVTSEDSIYLVTYTISGMTTGAVTVKIGGTSGTIRTANGIYTEQIIAGDSESIEFTPSSDFDGNIDMVTVRLLDAAGYMVVHSPSGTFTDNEIVTTATGSATANGTAAATTLTAGAEYEFVVTNFTGSADTTKIYGCNGFDRGFEWDGTTFVPIRTGMTVDAPEHIYAHHMQLFFSFHGSVQHSSPGDPFDWSVITGATEIAMGDRVTAFKGQPGADGTPALAILTRNSSAMLYGSGVSDWQLIPFKDEVGARARSVQRIGRTYMLDDRGIVTLSQSQAYGNFDDATVSQHIHDWIMQKRDKLTCSCVSRTLNLYMLFFSDKSGLFITIREGKAVAMMPMQFAHKVLCVWSYEKSNGDERILFGDENGYVHEMFKGTSFDGDDIESYINLSYVHFDSPTIRKRWRSVSLEAQGTGYFEYTFSYKLEYKSSHLTQPTNQEETVSFTPSVWDTGNWDSGDTWDGVPITPLFIRLHGIGTNISMRIYSRTDYCTPSRFSAALVKYTPAKELP